MAVQEVIKHGKKMRKIYNSREHSFWTKIKEMAVEIVIIVFAVSLSIWLHNWNEHRHEQEQVKRSLLALKQDIKMDIDQAKGIIESYHRFDTMYTYLSGLDRNKVKNDDALKGYLDMIPNNIYLRPNDIRFNSFLASGKISNIPNDSLALCILEYYQLDLPMVKSSENGWIDRNSQLREFLVDNATDMSSYQEQVKVLITPKGRYLTKGLIPWPQLYERYEALIRSGEGIIKQIDEEYAE